MLRKVSKLRPLHIRNPGMNTTQLGLLQIAAEAVAIVASPLIALWVTEKLGKKRQRQERRESVFRTLLGTRGARLDPAHVAALNMILLDFDGQDAADRSVVEACKNYFIELGKTPLNEQRATEIFDELLYLISRALGYAFDRADTKTRWYSPMYYIYNVQHQTLMRTWLKALSEGKSFIPVREVTDSAPSRQPLPAADASPMTPIVINPIATAFAKIPKPND